MEDAKLPVGYILLSSCEVEGGRLAHQRLTLNYSNRKNLGRRMLLLYHTMLYNTNDILFHA